MKELLQSFEMTTPTGWIISILLAIIIYFLKRFMKSFDKLEQSVEKVSDAIIEHRTIVDGHEKRIDKIEKAVFNE